MNFKEKYQKEIDSLQFSQDFGKVLTERTLYASEREDNRIIMKKRMILFHIFFFFFLLFVLLLVCSILYSPFRVKLRKYIFLYVT